MAMMPDFTGREHATVDAAARFEIPKTITSPDARQAAISSARLAAEMIARLPDGDQLIAGLNRLYEAREFFVQAAGGAHQHAHGAWPS